MEIDPHIFRVLGSFLPILSPRKPPELNVHFGYLPPPATIRHTDTQTHRKKYRQTGKQKTACVSVCLCDTDTHASRRQTDRHTD